MSASRRGAQGESVKSKKNCTEKYAEWNLVPKNMQSCTPEKCLPESNMTLSTFLILYLKP
jgi:hypothetical protein